MTYNIRDIKTMAMKVNPPKEMKPLPKEVMDRMKGVHPKRQMLKTMKSVKGRLANISDYGIMSQDSGIKKGAGSGILAGQLKQNYMTRQSGDGSQRQRFMEMDEVDSNAVDGGASQTPKKVFNGNFSRTGPVMLQKGYQSQSSFGQSLPDGSSTNLYQNQPTKDYVTVDLVRSPNSYCSNKESALPSNISPTKTRRGPTETNYKKFVNNIGSNSEFKRRMSNFEQNNNMVMHDEVIDEEKKALFVDSLVDKYGLIFFIKMLIDRRFSDEEFIYAVRSNSDDPYNLKPIVYAQIKDGNIISYSTLSLRGICRFHNGE